MADPFQSQLSIKPDQIISILYKRKWLIVLPLCVTLTIGLFYTLTAKKTYEASTLILVQPQRVPTSYVQSVVTSSISERISTISQQILSRSNLEKIIDQFGLFENAPNMYLEDKIAIMRKRVQVKIERARHGAEAFSIVFTGSEPQRVMRIANTLASYFMDENLKVREAQAIGTSEFLDSELEKTRKRLEEREQRLAEYRKKYMGGLPDELESNLRTLDRLQTQLNAKYDQLAKAKDSLNILQTQIAQSKEMANQTFTDDFSSFSDTETFEESDNQKKLNIAQKQYDALLLRYTEKHPDVQKVKKTIEKLEAAIKEEKEKAQAESSADKASNDEPAKEEIGQGMPAVPNFAAIQQDAQKKQIQDEIKEIQSDISKLEQQMKFYQQRVDETPKRELELQALKRDYGNIQEIYNSLLDRKLEAELSVNMEKKQKGEQFRILDHARLPEKPISPNVKLLFLLSIMAGLGISAAAIFLLEIVNTTIRWEDQIEKDLGLKILGAIPSIKQKQDKFKTRFEIIAFLCCSLYAALFLCSFTVLYYKGLDRTINFIRNTFNL